MQPAARYFPPWLGQTRAPLASMCCSNPHQGIPFTTVTASHVTQSRVEYKCTILWGTDERLDLWEAVMHYTTCYLKIYVHAETFMLKLCTKFFVYYINVMILDFSEFYIRVELWREVFVLYSIDKSDCSRDVHCSEILSSVDWWLVTDILGQTVGSLFKAQTVMLQQNPVVTEPTIYKHYFIIHERPMYTATS
jgi:hypothetical protein